MKIRAVVTSFLASILSIQPAFADKLADGTCFTIDGFVQISPSAEGTCPLVEEDGDRFDVDYGDTPTCFSGQFFDTAITIDGKVFRADGSSESALTVGFPFGYPNAVSAIKIKRPGFVKGKIFTIDTISIPGVNVPPYEEAGEFLEVISGTRTYEEVVPYDSADEESSSSIEIFGDAFAGADFVGLICLEE